MPAGFCNLIFSRRPLAQGHSGARESGTRDSEGADLLPVAGGLTGRLALLSDVDDRAAIRAGAVHRDSGLHASESCQRVRSKPEPQRLGAPALPVSLRGVKPPT